MLRWLPAGSLLTGEYGILQDCISVGSGSDGTGQGDPGRAAEEASVRGASPSAAPHGSGSGSRGLSPEQRRRSSAPLAGSVAGEGLPVPPPPQERDEEVLARLFTVAVSPKPAPAPGNANRQDSARRRRGPLAVL